MLVKIEARILISPGTDFHFPSTSVPPGTFFKALSSANIVKHCSKMFSFLLRSSISEERISIKSFFYLHSVFACSVFALDAASVLHCILYCDQSGRMTTTYQESLLNYLLTNVKVTTQENSHR